MDAYCIYAQQMFRSACAFTAIYSYSFKYWLCESVYELLPNQQSHLSAARTWLGGLSVKERSEKSRNDVQDRP